MFASLLLCGCPGMIGTTSSTTGTASPGPTASSARPSSSSDDRASGASEMHVITIPDVTGMIRVQAEAAMRAAGVRGNLEVDHDDPRTDYKIAKACAQNPGGDRQTSATLQVSIRYCMPEVAEVDHTPILVGLSPEEATKRARAAGFTGKIEVGQTSGTCKVGIVCSVSPDHWELNQEHLMTLWVNKAMTISTPD